MVWSGEPNYKFEGESNLLLLSSVACALEATAVGGGGRWYCAYESPPFFMILSLKKIVKSYSVS